MIARAGSGWQTVLADLSLILFMVTASALQQAQDQPAAAAQTTALTSSPGASPALAEPVAVWRAGGPPLAQWLAEQNPDARQRLTIVAHHAGDPQAASAAALALARTAGRPARIVLEADGGSGVTAALTYDSGGTGLALD